MKQFTAAIIATTLTICAPPAAIAETKARLFMGFTWMVGQGITQYERRDQYRERHKRAGISLQVLLTDSSVPVTGSVGTTFYFDGTRGCSVGLAATASDAAAILAYDFCKGATTLSVGGAPSF